VSFPQLVNFQKVFQQVMAIPDPDIQTESAFPLQLLRGTALEKIGQK
jgi:hypothetical protein